MKQREIKFRGLTSKGIWEYGLLFYSHGTGEFKISRSNGWVPSYNNPDEGESTEYYNIDSKTVGQFTGLKDNNGKEVFEGDIIQGHPAINVYNTKIKSEVFFRTKEGRWVARTYFDDHHQDEYLFEALKPIHDTKIIGNIHQNPELLKE